MLVKRPEMQIYIEIFILAIFVAPVIEETLSRAIPLSIAIFVFGRSWPIIVVALISSVIFGYLHGGYEFIPIQGVFGIILCMIFLKCGGLQKKKLKATGVVMLTHSTYNGTIFLFSYILSI